MKIEVSFSRKEILKRGNVRIEDSRLYLFSYLFPFLFSLYLLSYDTITSYGYIITCHIEEHRRF